MNFFEYQDRARSMTKWLVLWFSLAVLALIVLTSVLVYGLFFFSGTQSEKVTTDLVLSEVFLQVSLGVITVVFLGSLFRMGQLKGGGKVVAEAMHGRLLDHSTQDADERKVLNVVEEMAIASGMPVPPVYLMEDQGINAFAAGYQQQDAVVGVTRGCIHELTRDELQGVIAHEFSHIANGDMRLNIRLMGIIYGILVIGMIGYYMMRGSAYTHSRRDKGGGLLFLGLGLIVIGYGGTFFGNLIKAAVSRQREFLADASAVQFTRNPDGISGALKKIGGYEAGSEITSVDTSEISHMLFEEGRMMGFRSLFATHPPLDERIRRVDPHWDGKPVVKKQRPGQSSRTAGVDKPNPTWSGIEPAAGFASGLALDESIAAAASPAPEHIQYAETMLAVMPRNLRDMAHEPFGARALAHALVIAAGEQGVAEQQRDSLKAAWSEEEYKLFNTVMAEVLVLPRSQFLPFIDIAIPSLKRLSPAQYRTFMSNLTRTITADNEISLFEWALFAVLRHNLESGKERRGGRNSLQDAMPECGVLLSALALVGHDDSGERLKAFNAGATELGQSPLVYDKNTSFDVRELDKAMDRLRKLKPLEKPRLLKAMVRCIEADGHITLEESELVRTVASLLDCPLPPFLDSDS